MIFARTRTAFCHMIINYEVLTSRKIPDVFHIQDIGSGIRPVVYMLMHSVAGDMEYCHCSGLHSCIDFR